MVVENNFGPRWNLAANWVVVSSNVIKSPGKMKIFCLFLQRSRPLPLHLLEQPKGEEVLVGFFLIKLSVGRAQCVLWH